MLGSMQAVRVVVRGRVQGVGFRAWVVREATAMGVSGEVANRPDGSVEVEGVGSAAALERFVAALRRGPAPARVEQVVADWFEREPARHGFHISR
jgi:acylphosphatase